MSRAKWVRRLGVGVVVLAVVVVGAVVAIRLVQGGSKPVLVLPTVTTTGAPAGTGTTGTSAPSSGATNVDGTWKVASGSTAGYRVQETLFGLSNTAIGRTSAVTGTMTIAGTTVSTASFSVDLTEVSSDRSQRDGQFQGRIMDTSSFPTATFVLSQPIGLASLPANGVQVAAKASGQLTLHGVAKAVTFTVNAQRNGSTIQVQGAIPVTFADYNISNPSGGPATTGDTGTVEFLLNFSHA